MRQKIIALISLFFLIIGQANVFATQASGTIYNMDVMNAGTMNGGGTFSSNNFTIPLFNLGDVFGVPSNFASTIDGTTSDALVGQLALITAEGRGGENKLIDELKARTDVLGEFIAQKTWTKDDDPYFYWQVVAVPTSLVAGFSWSMDKQPDFIINLRDQSYQFSQHSLSSGKHTFYVLPFTTEELWDNASQLSFEIWVDTEVPKIGSITPTPKATLAEKSARITCELDDTDSGIDPASITLTLNNNPVPCEFLAEKKVLQSQQDMILLEGINTVFLRACDNVGNCLTKGWEFLVDTSSPEGRILINNGDQITTSAYVNVNIIATDVISGIKYIYLSNDGVFDTELKTPFNYSPQITGWLLADPDVDGKKTVYAMFEDNLGNRSKTFTAEINLKLRTPDTRIISGPPPATEGTDAKFTFEASKPGCSFSYKLDNQGWSPWTDLQEASFSGLALGNHHFYVKSGYDTNGDGSITLDEEDPTPASWVWTVGKAEEIERLRRTLFWRR